MRFVLLILAGVSGLMTLSTLPAAASAPATVQQAQSYAYPYPPRPYPPGMAHRRAEAEWRAQQHEQWLRHRRWEERQSWYRHHHHDGCWGGCY